MAEEKTMSLFVKNIREDIMRELKVYAAQRGLTMREAVEIAIVGMVNRAGK